MGKPPGRSRTVVALPLAGALLVPFVATPSSASWQDTEYSRGVLAAASCTDGYESTSSAQVLGGDLLGIPLATVAELDGTSASNPGTGATVQQLHPLAIGALSLVNAQLGGLLQLDLAAPTGVVRQFAEARPTGWSSGAAGAVADAGAIDLEPPAPGDPVPRFATLELGAVLSQLAGAGLGSSIAGLADARLDVGAVASYATLDGCEADWTGDVYDALERDYVVAGLGTTLESPLEGELVTTTNSGAQSIRGLVAALAGHQGLVNGIAGGALSGVSGLLGGLLGAVLKLGTPQVSVALDLNLGALTSHLAEPISDDGGILAIDLDAGNVTVDLARLLGPAYEDSVGLNGLAPNTELLLNDEALGALLSAVTGALSDWIADVGGIVNSASEVLDVDLTVTIPVTATAAGLLSIQVATVTVRANHVTLSDLLAGTALISVGVALLPYECNLVTAAFCLVVNPLVSSLLNLLTGAVLNGVLGPLVGGLLTTLLTPVPGLASLISALTADANELLAFLSAALGALFGPDAVLSLVVNAQNAPDPSEVRSPAGIPPTWSLSAPSTSPYRTGEYSVAALRLVTLGLLAGGIAIDLARSTAGSNGPG